MKPKVASARLLATIQNGDASRETMNHPRRRPEEALLLRVGARVLRFCARSASRVPEALIARGVQMLSLGVILVCRLKFGEAIEKLRGAPAQVR